MISDVLVQPPMFEQAGVVPLYAELTVVQADGACSYGLTLRGLHNLELLAQAAELVPQEEVHPANFYAACDALLRSIRTASAPFPE